MKGLRDATVAAERGLALALLDCAISNQPQFIAEVRAWLDPNKHVTKGTMSKVSLAVFRLCAVKGPITAESIAITLKSDDPPPLSELADLILESNGQASHLRFFALETVKCWRARETRKEAIEASHEIGHGGDVDIEIERLSGLREKLMPAECNDGLTSYGVLDEMLEESRGERPVDPGYVMSCQTLTKGLERVPRGSFVVVAAPTGVGKTIMLTQECVFAAKRAEGTALLFSCEMSVRQLCDRIAKSISGIPAVRSKEYAAGLERVKSMLTEDHSLRIYAGPRNLDSIEQICAAENERGRLSLIAIDYIQILSASEARGSESNSREQEVSLNAKRCKRLAVKYDCVVMAASQLNKQNKLRESEAIGFDADCVLLLTELEASGYDSKIGIVVEKNRHGSRGRKLILRWDKALFRFRDLEIEDE